MGKTRLEPLSWDRLSKNLSWKRKKGSELFAIIERTKGGLIHPPADLYLGQLLWCPESKSAWVDLALQHVDDVSSPEEAMKEALACFQVKDLSFVRERYWDGKAPVGRI